MSYASVAASNVSPQSPQVYLSPGDSQHPNYPLQPQPDPALLNTSPPEASDIIDDTAKINVVDRALKENPRTYTSEAHHFSPSESDENKSNSGGHDRDKRLREAKAEGTYLWEAAKRFLLRPKTAGGCFGLGSDS